MAGYSVHFSQGQGGMPIGEFDSLEEALECAAEAWGDGSVGIQNPDGSWHEFDEAWKMPPKLILMRPRKGKLNPRQEHIRKRWMEDRFLRMLLRSLDERPKTPGNFLYELAGLMEDVGNGWPDAVKLFTGSLDWGLFELFEWQNGWPRPNEHLDEGIASGQVKSI